jgi:bifunctional DNA-binding transcriptional regulator/antitoxin component of YhaV-PrlF toxin-antitoxin module
VLPKEIRETLDIKKKVLMVSAGDHIKIIPLPSDPLKVLHGAFKTKKPFRELRKEAERSAESEAEKVRS